MKNLFWFFILTGLLIFTYYYQELGQYYRENLENKQSKLLKGNTSEIKAIHFKDYTLRLSGPEKKSVRVGAVIENSRLPVAQGKLDQFLHGLSFIKVQRKINLSALVSKERESILAGLNQQIKVSFSDKEVTYQLGRQTKFSKAFYMSMSEGDKSQVFLCFNNAPRFQAYDPKEEVDTGPYLKVVELFLLPESFSINLIYLDSFPL